jgi:HK97 family phage major capsid protein
MPLSRASTVAEPRRSSSAVSHTAHAEEYARSFDLWIRHGWEPSLLDAGISAETRAALLRGERRDMGMGGQAAYPGATTGFFVPLSFSEKVEQAQKYFGPMLDSSSTITTERGGPFMHPTDNDVTTAGEAVPEAAQISTADIPLAQANFGAVKYSSRMIKVSAELFQDAFFDWEEYLSLKFGQRFGRCLNPVYTQSLLAAAPVSVTATGASANSGTGTGGVSIGTADIVNLIYSVDFSYRRREVAALMMHPLTLASLLNLLDKYGRPVYPRPKEIGMPQLIEGYPVYENPDFPQIGLGATTIAFGQLSKFVIRKAGGMWIQRLSERFADFGVVALIGWTRQAGLLLDAGTHPIQCLKMAAS